MSEPTNAPNLAFHKPDCSRKCHGRCIYKFIFKYKFNFTVSNHLQQFSDELDTAGAKHVLCIYFQFMKCLCGDLPSGPVDKTQPSQCRRPGLDTWSKN